MSNSSVIRNSHSSLVARISTFFEGLRESHNRYRVYRQTVRELSVLSDRELNDLGIHRSMLDSIAIEAAYGK
jgi:uncharacterized protein YjiS (DUF1127 family)